jgi:hypothetical protein
MEIDSVVFLIMSLSKTYLASESLDHAEYDETHVPFTLADVTSFLKTKVDFQKAELTVCLSKFVQSTPAPLDLPRPLPPALLDPALHQRGG